MEGFIPLQVQNFAFPFVTFHEVPVSPYFQPVKVPVNGGITIWCISILVGFVSSANLSRGDSDSGKYSVTKYSFTLVAQTESRILSGGLGRKNWMEFNSIV